MGLNISNEVDEDNKMKQCIDDLRKRGHICIQIKDVYPRQFKWCEKEVCQQRNINKL